MAGFLLGRQFRAGKPMVAQVELDHAAALGREAGEFGALRERLRLAVERLVLPQFRPETRDFGEQLVIGLAPGGSVHHAVQVSDHAPCVRELLERVFERCDEVFPSGRGALIHRVVDRGAGPRDEFGDDRLDVLRPEAVEGRELKGMQQRMLWCVHRVLEVDSLQAGFCHWLRARVSRTRQAPRKPRAAAPARQAIAAVKCSGA